MQNLTQIGHLLFLISFVCCNVLQLSIIISSKKFGQTEIIKMSNQCFLKLFCMQNLKPDNFELFVRPNSKSKIVDYPSFYFR